MSSAARAHKDLPKKDRKALARELARFEREQAAARRHRRRVVRRVSLATTGVAVVVVALLVVQAQARAGRVGPHNMLSDGVVLSGDGQTLTARRTTALDAGADPVPTVVDRSGGVLDIVAYLDYRDADAAAFWSASSTALTTWVTGGLATLELHPLALLDGQTVTTTPSPTATPTDAATAAATADPVTTKLTGDYSARAAGALACVADVVPDKSLDVHNALMAAQPGLAADGMGTDDLVTLVQNAGVPDQAVSDCIKGGDFTDWAQDATARAADSVPYDSVGSVTSSPVILVAGQRYTGALDDATAFTTFVSDVYTQVEAESAAAGATDDPTAGATSAPTDGATTEPTDAATEGSAG
ncbi:hypothetical protein AGMMS50218_12300 [Actinomycetota bacterium]|nr:hypothetical protein AGMMS50218_12300 [Actinomycetota bacterium]